MSKEFNFEPGFDKEININEPEINIKKILNKLLYQWKWYLLFASIAISLAYYYLDITSNVFVAYSTIIIDDGEDSGNSELSALSDIAVLGNQKSTVPNEIGILKSVSLMEKVVRRMRLNISYEDYELEANSQLFGDSMPLNINFFGSDSLIFNSDTSFIVQPISETHFLIGNEESEISKKIAFGESIETSLGVISVTPKDVLRIPYQKKILVKVYRPESVVGIYSGSLAVLEPKKGGSLITVTLENDNREKAIYVLNALIEEYNQDGINYRTQLTERTDFFINSRIKDISDELKIADIGIEDYKQENNLTDIALQSNIALQKDSELETQIVDLSSQMLLVDYMLDYLNQNPEDLIPTNLGVNNTSMTSYAQMYNELLLQRNRILKGSSTLNPTIITIDEQLMGLRENIKQSLLTLKSSINFSISQAQGQEARLNAKRNLAPKQEREIQDIQRKQQIIESLYMYLLQKREENAIQHGAASPNAKVIDKAASPFYPIYPSKKKIYMIALLMGLLLPTIFILIFSFFDNKTHTLEDIQNVLSAPILGDIPKAPNKKVNIIVRNSDRDGIAEAFRILRTNINFILSGNKKKCKSIFVTSTIAGEGKTFVSINLASVLASTNKRVLLVGADLRKPKISKYLKNEKGKGLTHFLINDNEEIIDIINSYADYEFDIINSGEIPPNPAELLLNDRFRLVLDYANENYDFLIVDTPPVSMVTDTLVISHFADMFVYVIRAEYLDKRLLKIPKKIYDDKRLPKMTVLVNSTDYSKSGYEYGYGYGYSQEIIKKPWWRFS